MLKIWGRRNSINVQKVMWCVDELGLAHEHIDAGGAFGIVKEPQYLAMNPNGLAPTIEDDGFTLWESNVIVRYLSARYGAGQLYPATPAAAADVDRWMDWQVTMLWPVFRPVFVGLVRTPPAERNQKAIDAAVAESARTFAILDRHLEARAYVGGDRLTMGDIPIGCVAYRWFALPINRPDHRHLKRWHDRLTERLAYRTNVVLPLT